MDPSACLAAIFDALDHETFTEHCSALASWLDKGGYLPAIPVNARHMPGHGTGWAVLSPAPDNDDVWELVRYSVTGRAIKRYPLEKE